MSRKVNAHKVWEKIFPYIPKIGDKVRLPYGKVDWMVWQIYKKENLVKLRRHYRSTKFTPSGKLVELPWWRTITVDTGQEMRKVGHI